MSLDRYATAMFRKDSSFTFTLIFPNIRCNGVQSQSQGRQSPLPYYHTATEAVGVTCNNRKVSILLSFCSVSM